MDSCTVDEDGRRVGGSGRQFSSCFDDSADVQSCSNEGLKVIETLLLFFFFTRLIRFSELLETMGVRREKRERPGEPGGI